MVGADDVLKFWLDEVGPKGWFAASDELDNDIRRRFDDTLAGVADGRFSFWLTYPSGALAYIIVADQFSRNMYRGTARAFATDRIALSAAKSAIARGWDLKIDEPARRFFYMPLMHSENLCDLDRCVRLMHERMPEEGAAGLLHARAHRAVIRRFGRFPSRNEALARTSTKPEADFMAEGGYGDILRSLEQQQAA
jgi:uncharacterized protein (DUF924 family)